MAAKKQLKAIRQFLASIGRKGGRSTAKRLTPQQRKAAASKAVKARWAKEKAKKQGKSDT